VAPEESISAASVAARQGAWAQVAGSCTRSRRVLEASRRFGQEHRTGTSGGFPASPECLIAPRRWLSVLWPTIFMAVDRGTPARSRFGTAVRRKSWGMRPGRPARQHAVSHALRKDLIGRPVRWNTHGMIARVAFSTALVRARWRSSTARRAGGEGDWRPSAFSVSPGSRCSQPLWSRPGSVDRNHNDASGPPPSVSSRKSW
jgi:hypothetical protein